MKHIYTLTILLIFNQLSAQINDCDCANRYQEEVFNDITVETNVTYSDAVSYTHLTLPTNREV